MSDNGMNNNTNRIKCTQLSSKTILSEEQYNKIAELIFETDPYIYPVMFGTGNEGVLCAKALLPLVFESKQDSMFSKDNLFVIEKGKQIAGLILWHKGKLHWNIDALIEIASQNGIKVVKDNIEIVRKEYVEDCYVNNDLLASDTLSLINICVDKRMRGQGIGKLLLSSFIKEHANERIELTVLADNLPAIRLYKNNGFEKVSEEAGFALITPKPMCLTMLREPNKHVSVLPE